MSLNINAETHTARFVWRSQDSAPKSTILKRVMNHHGCVADLPDIAVSVVVVLDDRIRPPCQS